MEAVLVKFDILSLSNYQLQKLIPPSHSGVVPKLIMMWTVGSTLMDPNPVNLSDLRSFLSNPK